MRYRVLLTGGNVLVGDGLRKTHGRALDGVSVLGFATTRVVSAWHRDDAGKAAIEAAYQGLRDLIANGSLDPPTFSIEEVQELEDDEANNGPNAGFTFFRSASTMSATGVARSQP